MPGRSALTRAIDPQAEWDTGNHLIAELIDRLDLANWLTYKVNFESNDMPMPDPFPRPGKVTNPETEIEFASNEEIANALSFNF